KLFSSNRETLQLPRDDVSRASGQHRNLLAVEGSDDTKMRYRIVTVTIVCLLNLYTEPWADDAAAQQNSVDGKLTRDGIDLFYRIVGPRNGDYILVLSGGPGEDVHSMEGVADELAKNIAALCGNNAAPVDRSYRDTTRRRSI